MWASGGVSWSPPCGTWTTTLPLVRRGGLCQGRRGEGCVHPAASEGRPWDPHLARHQSGGPRTCDAAWATPQLVSRHVRWQLRMLAQQGAAAWSRHWVPVTRQPPPPCLSSVPGEGAASAVARSCRAPLTGTHGSTTGGGRAQAPPRASPCPLQAGGSLPPSCPHSFASAEVHLSGLCPLLHVWQRRTPLRTHGAVGSHLTWAARPLSPGLGLLVIQQTFAECAGHGAHREQDPPVPSLEEPAVQGTCLGRKWW